MTASTERQGTMPAVVLDSLILVTLILTLAGWLFDPFRFTLWRAPISISAGIRPFVVLMILVAGRVWISRRRDPDRDVKKGAGLIAKLSLSLFMVTLALVGIEAVLGWRGVPHGEPVFVVQGRDGQSVNASGSMVSDSHLLWRFEPGTEFNGRKVNVLGYLGRQDIAAVKADRVTRIVCMGDSCTAQGLPNYADMVHQRFQENTVSDRVWEAFSAGVHGYSVLQGLRQYQRDIRPLQPDVVTIFFGWNDHWLTEQPDRERMELARGRLEAAILNGLAKKRLIQLTSKKNPGGVDRRELRVPPDAYATYLGHLIDEIKRDGAMPFVVTAPRAKLLSRRLVHAGHAESVEGAMALHDHYVEISRTVASEKGVIVIDLAAEMSAPDFFMEDGIHFTGAGLQRIAERIHESVSAYAFSGLEP